MAGQNSLGRLRNWLQLKRIQTEQLMYNIFLKKFIVF